MKNLPQENCRIVLCVGKLRKSSLVFALRASLWLFTKWPGAILNSFSWPAKQVSYKDVAHKFVPYEFVNSVPGHHLIL
jgi:hypothetical protein